jgi:hypothetical protein
MQLVCPRCQFQFTHATLADRLWNQVVKGQEPDDCWIWIGPVNAKGYGSISLGNRQRALGTRGNKRFYSHRLAYELTTGSIPDGMFVCHKCDNPRCCNPAHLFLGTPNDNVQDMISKGRKTRKLTEEQVRNIRIRFAAGDSISKLAIANGVSRETIRAIVSGRTWRHLA